MPDTPKTVFVGAGAVATVLARRMAARGFPIAGIISRTKASAAVLAEQVGAPVATSRLEELPEQARWIFVCVPDDTIEEVVDALQQLAHPWEECVVAHTAGAIPSSVLTPLAEKGASTASMHPVQTFQREAPPALVEGITFTLEGDANGVRILSDLVEQLGARPVRIAAGDRAAVHLASAIASNFFVTLQAAAVEVLQEAGVPEAHRLALLQPLVESTWHNMLDNSPMEALTGPIQRGDISTVRTHVRYLRDHLPHLLPFYRALARETARLARKKGDLTADEQAALDQALQEAKSA